MFNGWVLHAADIPHLLSVQPGIEVTGVWSSHRDGLCQPQMGNYQIWALPSEEGNTWQGWKVSSNHCAWLGLLREWGQRSVELGVKPSTVS